MTLQDLLIISIVKPEVLPDNINLRKIGILDEKVWGSKRSKDQKDNNSK